MIESAGCPRWLHRWAVFTACAAFLLLLFGALVTSRQAGMADPVWPTYPWHLLLVSWQAPRVTPRPGFLIEHTHRLAGYLVGCCVIVLAAGLWFGDRRRWLRWLGMAALAGVTFQGLLGGFRVKLDEWLGPNLALIHGCFAQIVFALLVSLAVVTSRGWAAEGVALGSRTVPTGRCPWALRRWSLATVALVYVQVFFGALLRHTYAAGQRGHLLVAFAVVVAVVWLTKEVWDHHADDKSLVVPATILAILVAVQLVMGVEAWMIRMSDAGVSRQIAVRTGHVLLGSLIFATSVVVALQAHHLHRVGVKELESGSAQTGALALSHSGALTREGAA